MVAAQFTAYEIFAIISGISLIIMAMLPGLEGTARLWSVLGGAFFIGYGIYVSQQVSGTYYFPAWIFIIPFAALVYLAISAYEWFTRDSSTEDPRARSDVRDPGSQRSQATGTLPSAPRVAPRPPLDDRPEQQRGPISAPSSSSGINIPPQPGTR